MTVIPFDPPAVKVPRDGRKRLVRPLDGGKPVTYTRCTTYVDCLEDTYHLNRWEQRMVATGLADRPDLLLAVSAHRDDKDEMNTICYRAKEAAKSSAASTMGTAVHALCERVDRGHKLGMVPSSARRDVEAYQRATESLEHLYIEQFCVEDELKIGGTPDRVVKWGDDYFIADIKTGKDIQSVALKIAMQLAVYAHSTPYDPVTEQRKPFPFLVDNGQGLVIHLPVGEATAKLYFVDLIRGWDAVQTARYVRQWRSEKNWYEDAFCPNPFALPGVDGDIVNATTVDELRRVATAAVIAGTWTEERQKVALLRKAELERETL